MNEKTIRQNRKLAIWYNPTFQVVATWLWIGVGVLLVKLVFSAIYGVSLAKVWEMLWERTYLAAYIEIVAIGLLPVIFTLISKDDPAVYGLSRKGLGKSLLFSSLCVAVSFGIEFLLEGRIAGSSHSIPHMDLPWNVWYGVLGIFAYGPLEVFFVLWLVVNTDRIFKSVDKKVSWGLIITVVVFGLLHIPATGSIFNAFMVMMTFLVLGLIYKYTKNSIGPMIAWTLVNRQVWYFVRLLLS